MSIEFFVATDDEVTTLPNGDGIYELLFLYNFCAAGANDFQAVRWIAEFFFQNDDGIPDQILKSVNCESENRSYVVNIYKLDRSFVEKVTNYDIDKLRDPATAEYWHQRGYYSPGIWNAMYGLHRFCRIAVKNNINVYIYEELHEPQLDG